MPALASAVWSPAGFSQKGGFKVPHSIDGWLSPAISGRQGTIMQLLISISHLAVNP
jgi:hypothetical protein